MRNTSVFSNFSQRNYRYSTNTKFTVRRTNTYTHTYIHTDRQTDTARVQHVNVGLAQASPNQCLMQCCWIDCVVSSERVARAPILLYLGHPREAILDPLGIAVCLLLTPPPLVFIHALAFCQETTQML